MPRRYATYPKTSDVKVSRTENTSPLPKILGTTYIDGVEDACKRVAADARLAVKMTSGDTLGETIAQQIKRDLL